MLTAIVALVVGLVGIRYGYWLKEKEIEEGSLVEALVPDEAERAINKATGKEVFEVDLDKGSNND